MARSVSDEEVVLKKRARRRLIGAIALVTLVIVLLPMFLDSEPRPLNQEISIQIPPESSQFSSRVAALPPPPAQGGAKSGPDPKLLAEPPQPAASEAERPAADTEGKPAEGERRAPEQERRAEPEKRPAQERPAKQETPAKAAQKAEPKAAPKAEPKPTAETSKEKPKEKEREANGESFVVQVAALTDAEKARTLKGRIVDNGLRAYTEVVKTARGDVTRVRVGPFGSKEAAQKAADDLKKIGLSGVVAPRG